MAEHQKLYSGDISLNIFQSIAYYRHALYESFRGFFDFENATHPPKDFLSELGTLQGPGLTSPLRYWTEICLRNSTRSAINNMPMRILDLGCGSGRYHEFFLSSAEGSEYVGVDHKSHKTWADLNGNKIQNLKVSLLADDAEELRNVEGKFDLWMSSTAFEHFQNENNVLTAVDRHLRSGAIGYHVVPAHHSWLVYFKHGYRRYYPSYLRKMFEAGGHQVLDCQGLGGPFELLLHLLFITLPERILRVGSVKNKAIVDLYYRLFKICAHLDWYLPSMWCQGYFVKIQFKGSSFLKSNSAEIKETAFVVR